LIMAWTFLLRGCSAMETGQDWTPWVVTEMDSPAGP